MTGKAKLIDLSKCMGCRACQVACKQWNRLPAEKTDFFAHGGGYQNPSALSPSTWRVVKFYEKTSKDGVVIWRFRVHACMHCISAACMDICPAEPKAMSRDAATGFVYVNEDNCIGCGSCVEACPFNVPHVDQAAAKARKCTGCVDRIEHGREPACAQTCPPDAISFGDLAELLAKARAREEELGKQGFKPYVYGIKERSGMRTLYILPEGREFYDLPANPVSPAGISRFKQFREAMKDDGLPLTAGAIQEFWARSGTGDTTACQVV